MEIVDIGTPADLIPRHAKDGRPRIFRPCGECDRTGRVPGAREGTTKKCPTCKGEGAVGAYYTRMTTFIDCLEDKSNLSQWKQRNAVLGMSRKPGLMTAFSELADPHGTDKNAAGALIHEAEVAADADLKAKVGDALHEIIEKINRGQAEPFVPEEHENDIAAYKQALLDEGIIVVMAECFVVLDKFQVGGTFDILGLHYPRAPNGRISWGAIPKLRIMDVKTGRIDYGRSKIGMQLTGYGQSELYDPATFDRTPITWTIEDGTVLSVDQEKALIIHLPAGQGECSIVPVDMADATDGLQLAWDVRQFRKRKFDEAPLTVVSLG